MKQDHRETENSHDGQRQVDERRHHYHRCTDHPDHLGHSEEVGVVEAERDEKTDHRKLENDKPKPSSKKETRKFALALAAHPLQIDADARKKHESRRAVVRYPSRKEQRNGRRRGVSRVRKQRLVVNKISRVIEKHYHHHNAAKKIYGVDSLSQFLTVHIFPFPTDIIRTGYAGAIIRNRFCSGLGQRGAISYFFIFLTSYFADTGKQLTANVCPEPVRQFANGPSYSVILPTRKYRRLFNETERISEWIDRIERVLTPRTFDDFTGGCTVDLSGRKAPEVARSPVYGFKIFH